MGARQREYKDKIGDYEDSMDNIAAAIGRLKFRIEALEERIAQAESILKLIHYESNPAYLEGLKNKYDEMYGVDDE
jgi:phage shock protein A